MTKGYYLISTIIDIRHTVTGTHRAGKRCVIEYIFVSRNYGDWGVESPPNPGFRISICHRSGKNFCLRTQNRRICRDSFGRVNPRADVHLSYQWKALIAIIPYLDSSKFRHSRCKALSKDRAVRRAAIWGRHNINFDVHSLRYCHCTN